jgi:hypothetical protein
MYKINFKNKKSLKKAILEFKSNTIRANKFIHQSEGIVYSKNNSVLVSGFSIFQEIISEFKNDISWAGRVINNLEDYEISFSNMSTARKVLNEFPKKGKVGIYKNNKNKIFIKLSVAPGLDRSKYEHPLIFFKKLKEKYGSNIKTIRRIY